MTIPDPKLSRKTEQDCSDKMLEQVWAALGGALDALDRVNFTGPSAAGGIFPVGDLVAAATASVGLAVCRLLAQQDGKKRQISVDRRLAALWCTKSISPIGWELPPLWAPLSGDYRADGGWIRLHMNAPSHRAAALGVLGLTDGTAEDVAQAVKVRDADELEQAIVEAGGAAAAMRTTDQWQQHPQGRAVTAEPVVGSKFWPGRQAVPQVSVERPLAGVRVLDLTRILAGPVATRTLAAFGADVLRIDPPDWDEPGVAPEVMPGKRSARLDLHLAADREKFEAILAEAHILIHSYRPGALERLGYDEETRRKLSPGLIDVTLNAYGWHGPWAGRRGFDSLVQMSSGIADMGMRTTGAAKPVPLPFQALDHATGLLMAAAAICGLCESANGGGLLSARLSLARTAVLLGKAMPPAFAPELAGAQPHEFASLVEATGWGPALRLKQPLAIEGVTIGWDRAARPFGLDPLEWR